MDDKYATEQFNGGNTSLAFVAEVNKTYDDLLTQKSKVKPPPTQSPEVKALLEQYEGTKNPIKRKQIGRQIATLRNKEAASEGAPILARAKAQGVTRGSMKLGQNKVGPQTADLKAAIAKKLAMSGDTSTAAAATQQGGGNTQITNVSKKDGDVTHMPKSDIRNNKFAALTGSRLYPAGAI